MAASSRQRWDIIGAVAELSDDVKTNITLRFVGSSDKVEATIDISNAISKENKKGQKIKIKYEPSN